MRNKLFRVREQVKKIILREPFPPLSSITSREENLSLYRSSRMASSGNCPNRPLHLLIEVTSKCNLSCKMCNIHHDDKSGITIDHALLETTFQLAETAHTVYPFGLGEPLLHPHIVSIVERYKASGSMVSLTTNGMLMNEEISEGFIAGGLDYLAISIDAAETVLLSEIRKGADLKKISDNIMSLNRLKKARQSKTPYLSLNVVVQAGNFHQLPMIIRLAEQWNISSVTFSPITVHKHIPKIQNEIVGPEFIQGKKILEDCGLEAEARGVRIDTRRLDLVLKGSRWDEIYRKTMPCPEPFRFMVIRANGDIFPCCNWDVNKPVARIDVSKRISVTDLEEAWRSQKWHALRERVVLKNYPAECRVCMSNFTRPFCDEEIA